MPCCLIPKKVSFVPATDGPGLQKIHRRGLERGMEMAIYIEDPEGDLNTACIADLRPPVLMPDGSLRELPITVWQAT